MRPFQMWYGASLVVMPVFLYFRWCRRPITLRRSVCVLGSVSYRELIQLRDEGSSGDDPDDLMGRDEPTRLQMSAYSLSRVHESDYLTR